MFNRVSNQVLTPPVAPQPAPVASVRFVGRQPILDAAQKVVGYELLFRTGWENSFTGDPESVGHQMIDNALVFGMDTLVHGARAFIKCTRDTLTSRFATCLPVLNTVLQIPASIPIDQEVLAACKELKQIGYEIALDDFLPGSSSELLFDMADFIKLDFRSWETTQPLSIRRGLQKSRVAAIAKKVESAGEFTRANDEGFRYFQGYFFAHPTVLTSPEIPSNPLTYIKLLAAIDRSPSDRNEIERLVSSEASLCFRLLHLVNSGEFGARDRVSSIRQALLMVGEAKLRKLVTIAAATSLKTNATQSPELMLLCLHRARFCELLAPRADLAPGEQHLIGLLSVVNAMLNIPMQKLLNMLPLPATTTNALLGLPSSIDLPLRIILCYEQNDWASCASYCEKLGISEEDLTSIYLDSLQWANERIVESAQ